MSVFEVTVGVPVEKKMGRFTVALQAAMEGSAIARQAYGAVRIHGNYAHSHKSFPHPFGG